MAKIHAQCGRPMVPTRLSRESQPAELRQLPVWLCTQCSRWEPRETHQETWTYRETQQSLSDDLILREEAS